MINSIEETKKQIMRMVSGSKNQRIRPHNLEKSLSHETGVPISTIKKALKDLMQKGQLVFTYRDPCSYVEVPAVQSH